MLHLKWAAESPVFLWGVSFVGAFGWLNPANLNGQVTAIVGAGTTIVLGYISLSQMIDKRRHERRKLDLEDEVSRVKALDTLQRETLTGQLKVKQTQLDEMTKRAEEAKTLRNDLAEANKLFAQVSAQLAEANRRLTEK